MDTHKGSLPMPTDPAGAHSRMRMGGRQSPYRVARLFLSILAGAGLLWSLLGSFAGPGGPRPASAASDPVIAAAGDIACDPASSYYHSGSGTALQCHMKYTSDLLVNGAPAAVLALGDNQYNCGGYTAYTQSYGPTWGRVLASTFPVPGNHEYITSTGTNCSTGAAGYFQYYGSVAGTPGQGWYSYNIGAWHLIALNANCSQVGGCGTTSAEYAWLKSDLASHPNQCTLAYWHQPLFSSGGYVSTGTRPFWNLLYSSHADVVLNGHDHIYERFAQQTPSGIASAAGIREFTVGTGGVNHGSIGTLVANSEVQNNNTFGVLFLTLHSSSYDWHFVPDSSGTFTDSGTTACNSASASATATPTPGTAATATPTSASAPTATPTPGAGPTATPTSASIPTATNTPAPTATPTSSGSQSSTFVPQADAYVNSSYPSTNYGTSTQLRVDDSPIVNSYVRFTVSGLNGASITSVQLRLYANSSGSAGINALAVADNTWGETTITYSNAPAMGSTIATSGGVAGGTWVTLDVTSYVTAEGTYSFGILTPGSTAISLASRESGANAPQLIVNTGP